MILCGKEWQWLMCQTHLILEDVNDRAYTDFDEEYRIITQEDLSDPQVFDMYSMLYPALTIFQGAAESLLSRVHSNGGVDNHYVTNWSRDEEGNFRWHSL